MNKIILFLIFTIYGCVAVKSNDVSTITPQTKCNVLKVYDGDTITANCNQAKTKIRFACIDAPELKMNYGKESRDNLKNLLKTAHNEIYFQETNIDRYGRKVGQIWIESTKTENGLELIQNIQAENGWVWSYEKYSEYCPNWLEVNPKSVQARMNKIGLFQEINPIPPWNFRKENKANRS
jgi:endonuclease YncB( thermonuclease family)